jgi:hypothetical protein
MMPFAAFLFVLAMPQDHVFRPVPDYRPAFVPKALEGAQCDGVALREADFRGRRPVLTQWTLQKPFATVALALRRETQVEIAVENSTDETLGRRGMVTTYRKLPDRMIEVQLMAGRYVKISGPNFSGTEIQDRDRYVTATITERPLYVGPLPRTWYGPATKVLPVPRGFPVSPIGGLPPKPTVWARSTTPSGGMQYWLAWYVPESPDTFIPRAVRQLERSGRWKVSTIPEAREPRLMPTAKKGNPMVYIDLDPNRVEPPDVPKHYSIATLSWVDRDTGLGARKRTGAD